MYTITRVVCTVYSSSRCVYGVACSARDNSRAMDGEGGNGPIYAIYSCLLAETININKLLLPFRRRARARTVLYDIVHNIQDATDRS